MRGFLLTSILLLTGSYCQLHLKTVRTTGTNSTSSNTSPQGTRVISCKHPTSLLIIRTARYISYFSSSDHDGQHPSFAGCQGNRQGCHRDHVITPGDQMTSEDVMKVYRHCEDRSDWCDAAEAGVGMEFEMSYYCLEESVINPCSNITSEPLPDNTSLLFNYSCHAADCDLSCQCSITSDTSNSTTLYIQALNVFQERKEGHDGMASNQSPDAGFLVTKGCVDTRKQPKPRVLIKSSVRQWEVKRIAVPVQWQLGKRESSSLSLIFQGLHGIKFGRLWMDFKGPSMVISCGYTVQHGSTLPQHSTTSSPEKTFVSGNSDESGHLLIYLGVGGVLMIVLTVVIIIAVAKWKLRSKHRRTNQGNLLPDDNKQAHHNSTNDMPLGEYCTISDVTSTSSAQHHVTRSPSREDKQSIDNETTFSEISGSPSGGAIVQMVTHTKETDGEHEYGTLNHGPSAPESNWQRSEPVIYDHAGAFGPGGEDGDYHCLRHCVSVEPRVIDNIYDTMAKEAPS